MNNMATLVEQLKSLREKIDSYQDQLKSGKTLSPQDVDDLETFTKQAKHVKDRINMFKQLDADIDKLAGNNTLSSNGAGYIDLRSLAKSAPAKALEYSRRLGSQKGLVPSGMTLLPVPILNEPPVPGYAGAEIPPRLLDFIKTVPRDPVYSIIQEVTPDDGDAAAATVVAPYAEKPVKKLKLQRVDQRLRVVAVLSEPIDKYTLEDTYNVNKWMGTRLTLDLYNGLENEVLNGDGTGEHFTGLTKVTGTQSQDFYQSMPDTIAGGCAKLENIGVAPGVIALSAADWLAIQTLKATDGSYYLGNVLDPVKRMLWGHQVAVVPGLPKGSGWVIGADAINLAMNNGVKLDWDPYGGFTNNTMQARVEGRFNLEVLKPHAIVKLALSDGK